MRSFRLEALTRLLTRLPSTGTTSDKTTDRPAFGRGDGRAQGSTEYYEVLQANLCPLTCPHLIPAPLSRSTSTSFRSLPLALLFYFALSTHFLLRTLNARYPCCSVLPVMATSRACFQAPDIHEHSPRYRPHWPHSIVEARLRLVEQSNLFH